MTCQSRKVLKALKKCQPREGGYILVACEDDAPCSFTNDDTGRRKSRRHGSGTSAPRAGSSSGTISGETGTRQRGRASRTTTSKQVILPGYRVGASLPVCARIHGDNRRAGFWTFLPLCRAEWGPHPSP